MRNAVRAGFTLVEVLVTLLIVGGMMLAITQILEATRISRDTIHNIQETQLAGPAIMDLVERDLRGLFVYNRKQESLLRVVDRVEAGLEADSLDFVTTTDSLISTELVTGWVHADYNEVGYRLRPNPQDNDFLEIFRREGFGVDDTPFEGGAFTFLHDRVKHFSVQVYTEDGPDVEPLTGWSGSGEQVGLPLRLEVELVLELAPRISREQLRIAPTDKRTVVYRRIVRLPQSLRDTLEIQPEPVVPRIVPPGELAPQAGTPATAGGGAR